MASPFRNGMRARVLALAIMMSLCRALVRATLTRRQSRNNSPNAPLASLLRTKEIMRHSLSLPWYVSTVLISGVPAAGFDSNALVPKPTRSRLADAVAVIERSFDGSVRLPDFVVQVGAVDGEA